MRNIFLSSHELKTNPVTIAGPVFHHLVNVLRIRVGERITLLDNLGSAFEAEIETLGKKSVTAQILRNAEIRPEPAVHITVAQAVGKGDKLEQVIQHGSEIGASAFVPLFTERTTVKLSAYNSDKIERLKKVAKGAAEQCGRCRIPEVECPVTFTEFLNKSSEYDAVFILSRDGVPLPNELLKQQIAKPSRVVICIGPEGGYTTSELYMANRVGARAISLGPYVLRTETAALACIAQIMALAMPN